MKSLGKVIPTPIFSLNVAQLSEVRSSVIAIVKTYPTAAQVMSVLAKVGVASSSKLGVAPH